MSKNCAGVGPVRYQHSEPLSPLWSRAALSFQMRTSVSESPAAILIKFPNTTNFRSSRPVRAPQLSINNFFLPSFYRPHIPLTRCQHRRSTLHTFAMFSRAMRTRAVPAIRAARAQPIVAARTVTTNAAASSLEHPLPKVSPPPPVPGCCGYGEFFAATIGSSYSPCCGMAFSSR